MKIFTICQFFCSIFLIVQSTFWKLFCGLDCYSFSYSMMIIVILFRYSRNQVLDASWYMPDEQRNPLQEYQVFVVVLFLNTHFFWVRCSYKILPCYFKFWHGDTFFYLVLVWLSEAISVSNNSRRNCSAYNLVRFLEWFSDFDSPFLFLSLSLSLNRLPTFLVPYFST